MSRKSAKKRASSKCPNPNAAVLVQLSALSEATDLSGYDSSLLITHTSRILSLAAGESSERKVLVHRSSNGLAILFRTLKIAEDSNTVGNILAILEVLASHKYVGLLVRGGAVSAVMLSLIETSHSSWNSDPIILSHLTLLNKLSTKDKKFSVKARLSGILQIVTALLKRYQEDKDKLSVVLTLIKSLAINGSNSETLGRLGCLSILVKLLTKVSQRDLVFANYCINVLALLLKQRSNTNRPAAQDCVKQLVVLHEHLQRVDSHHRHIPLRRKTLNCLKSCISVDANLQVFHKNNGLRVLYTTAQLNSDGASRELRGITSLTCMVMRKCLPPKPLPLLCLENPTLFPLPHRLVESTSTSGSSSAKTTTSDLLLLTESCNTGEGCVNETISAVEPPEERKRSLIIQKLRGEVLKRFQSLHDQDSSACSRDDRNHQSVQPYEGTSSHPVNFDIECNDPSPLDEKRKIKIDLLLYKKYFPELEEVHDRLSFVHRDSQSANTWEEITGTPPTAKMSKFPVVMVPSASESCQEDLRGVGLEAGHSVEVKSATPFKGEPDPQILGHYPSPFPEPMFIKTPRMDRNHYLLDTSRVINSKALLNRTVFDLDVLSAPKMEPEDSTLPPASIPPAFSQRTLQDLKEIAERAFSRLKGEGSLGSLRSTSSTLEVCADVEVAGDHLEFESRFESGNLRKAIQVRQYEYDLLLNADINTNHHHQWFYFRVSRTESGIPYRFNIVNCEKPNSQFNFGMQPLMYSTTDFRLKRRGWFRVGTNISYYSNNFNFTSGSSDQNATKKKKTYYTMTFTVVFENSLDTCYFAYHYPYTFSMLQYHLHAIEERVKVMDLYYHRQALCTTLCGNICPLVTITSQVNEHIPSTGSSSEFMREDKKYIVLSARVHPGESNSSWIMKGVLDYLTSDHPNAQALRDKFVFKIIPMLNPDGVIHGSHRCSLSGEDLNRQWISPDPVLHPTIYSTKALLQWLVATNRKPEVYCDIHGHSRRKNIFMYGCKSTSNSNIEQVLPRHLNRTAPFFNYSFCSFAVEKSKEATARVVVWRELGVARSYTMESTYCGADQGQCKDRQIGTSDLEEMGPLLCEGLLHLDEVSPESASYDSDGVDEDKDLPSCHSDFSYKSTDEEFGGSASSHDDCHQKP